MTVFTHIEDFLLKYCYKDACTHNLPETLPPQSPLLLALSGGPDSLCLFYGLLHFRKIHRMAFHVAHVDHRWRPESCEEAKALHELCIQHEVPFHLKTLDPSRLLGNLEAACREMRYLFFEELCRKVSFQAVLTAHHLNDQAETVFKRILEGAHWSNFCMQPEIFIKGIRVLRPFLGLRKKVLEDALHKFNIKAFDDPSNRHLQFLRARLRETLFPRLNEEFGKCVEPNLAALGRDAKELTEYFDARLTPLFLEGIEGPFGQGFDLQTLLPASLLEIKYFLRLLNRRQGRILSREIIEQAACALESGKANRLFAMGPCQMIIDRKRVFLLSSPLKMECPPFSLTPDCMKGDLNFSVGNWQARVTEDLYCPLETKDPAKEESEDRLTSVWKEGWKGRLRCFLPVGNYQVGFENSIDSAFHFASIKKHWQESKVPAFLFPVFPLIWTKDKVCQEFLTGKTHFLLEEGSPCWKLEFSCQKFPSNKEDKISKI